MDFTQLLKTFSILLWLCASTTFSTVSCHKQWICISNYFCLFVPTSKVGVAIHFESQHDCRLSCGKYGAIWPMPTGECVLSNARVRFDPSKVQFDAVTPNTQVSQFVRETKRLFVSNILKECIRNCSLTDGKEVLVKTTVISSSLVLNLQTDESYTLIIKTTGKSTLVELKATTVYGARHAFETLSNLVTGGINKGLLMVSAARVNDRPQFAHRGLLLDTSRNYIPLPYIRKTLDAMAASKLNVFHWHVVDSHSFPLEIRRVPELQRYGAYSPEQVYSRLDTQNIVKYAKLRGIRVLIEIDGPSHAGNGWQWGPAAGLGNLAVCVNQNPWPFYCLQPPCGQLNPVNGHMYNMMKELYEDLAEVMAPEETLHMGGDEVYIPCWNATKEITLRMHERGYDLSLPSFYKLWSEFHTRNLASWDNVVQRQHTHHAAVPKSVIIWSSHLSDPEIIEKYLPKERFIIQTWVESSLPLNSALMELGYRIIITTTNAWYLDHGFWGETPYYDWMTVYNNFMQRHKLVLGGEVCMWSEYVDSNSLESRIWPRAGAAAERLWSDPPSTALRAKRRFYRYRDRLIARGIQPDAVTPRWCVLNEGQCF